jgi:DNA mismatch repair protein MutL
MVILILINQKLLVILIFFAKKLSKSSSIKSGKKLNLDEQEFLVNQLFSCKEPNLSPDNKQIFITLNKNDIENRF